MANRLVKAIPFQTSVRPWATGRTQGCAIEAVETNGGKALRPKHTIGPRGFRAVIADSGGNRLALHSPSA